MQNWPSDSQNGALCLLPITKRPHNSEWPAAQDPATVHGEILLRLDLQRRPEDRCILRLAGLLEDRRSIQGLSSHTALTRPFPVALLERQFPFQAASPHRQLPSTTGCLLQMPLQKLEPLAHMMKSPRSHAWMPILKGSMSLSSGLCCTAQGVWLKSKAP